MCSSKVHIAFLTPVNMSILENSLADVTKLIQGHQCGPSFSMTDVLMRQSEETYKDTM